MRSAYPPYISISRCPHPFKRWSDEAIRELDISSIDDLRRSGRAIKELNAYFSDIIEQRRQQPQDDLLSALILAEEEGDSLTVEEIYATCELLLIAGHETTTNLIGNGMLALLRNPEQLTLLRNAPDLMPNAIEELLRYDSPVQMTSRYALEDCELDGQAIKKGQQLVLLLGAANRDPAVYEQAERLDITRQDIKHLSFSIGIHFCLGAALARLEGQIAVSALLHRFPGLRLASDSVQWRDSATLRGLQALPVVI
jgi:pimeloyl-[acyl-carrier protein] synthase